MPVTAEPLAPPPAARPNAPEIVDVAIVGGDDDELKEMAKGLIVQDPGLKVIFEPSSPHELFETLRKFTRDGKKIGRLILAAHGDASHYIGLSEALRPEHVDLRAIRNRKQEALRSAVTRRAQAAKDRALLPGMKTDEDRRKLLALVDHEEELAQLDDETFRKFEQQETDLLGVADVMAEGGVIGLINCCPASDKAGLEFMHNLGRAFLARRGGRIQGAVGNVRLLQVVNLAQSWKHGEHGSEIGEYVMWGEGGWVTLPFAKPPDRGFVLGKLFVDGDVFTVSGTPPATDPLVMRTTCLLLSGAGHFKAQNWGPAGQSGPPPENLRYGPVYVPGPGTIRTTLQVDPPNPGGWTVVNSEAAITSSLAGREDGAAAVSVSTGHWRGTRTVQETEVSLPGWLCIEVEPPVGHGYHGGSHPEQSFAFKIELLEADAGRPSPAGPIRDGDRFKTGSSRAVLYLSNGVRILVREHSEVELRRTDAGTVRGRVLAGGVHVVSRKGAPHEVEYELRGRLLRPGGTVFSAQAGDDTTPIEVARNYDLAPVARVHEGWIDAVDPEGPGGPVRVEAGQEIDLLTGEVREQTRREIDDVFDQVPLGELLLDETPEPPGSHVFEPVPGRLPEGWTWRDPGKTGFNATPSTWEVTGGALCVTTRSGVRGHQAPMLLHKASGDFDLEVRVAVSAPGQDEARTRFLLYAPGAYLGVLGGRQEVAGAKRTEGFGADAFPLAGRCRRGATAVVGADASASSPPTGAPAADDPIRLKLSRRGDRFTVAWSPDAAAWTPLPDETLPGAPETLWAGLLFEHEPEDSFLAGEWGNRSELGDLRLTTGDVPDQPANPAMNRRAGSSAP